MDETTPYRNTTNGQLGPTNPKTKKQSETTPKENEFEIDGEGGTELRNSQEQRSSQPLPMANRPIWGWVSREGRVGGVNEQPRRAVKGLSCVGWHGVWLDF